MKVDISEKFGASWLGKGPTVAAPNDGPIPALDAGVLPAAAVPAPATAPNAPVAAEQAVLAKRVLSTLGQAPSKTEQVYGLIDRTGLDISRLLSVVDWLEGTGFISVTREKHGNHTLQLTEAGDTWIS